MILPRLLSPDPELISPRAMTSSTVLPSRVLSISRSGSRSQPQPPSSRLLSQETSLVAGIEDEDPDECYQHQEEIELQLMESLVLGEIDQEMSLFSPSINESPGPSQPLPPKEKVSKTRLLFQRHGLGYEKDSHSNSSEPVSSIV